MSDRVSLAVNAVVCLFSLTFLAAEMWDGLTFLSFYDEATHILGGKMLDSGAVLYRDFIDSHGPFIFFLTQVYGLAVGWSDPNTARAINVLFMTASVVSLATSPALSRTMTRVWAVTAFAGLMAAVWLRQGLFMVSFYPVAGALAGISLSSAALPACRGITPSRIHAFAAGLALAMLAATAYSFAPTALLFTAVVAWNSLGSGNRRPLHWLLLGEGAGIVLLVLYLHEFADLRGYLSFHFAESQFVYARYVHFSLRTFAHSLRLSAAPDDRVQSLAVCCTVGSVAVLGTLALRRRQLSRIPSFLGILVGVLALNARGASAFQNGAFVYAAMVVAAIAVASALETTPHRFGTGAALVTALLIAGVTRAMGPALYTPSGMSDAEINRTVRWPIGGASDGLFFQHIRTFARPDEGILALAYQPGLYLLADRAPMKGFYAYFPWDADYAKGPWFDRPRDLCLALTQRPPPVVVYNDYPLWGYSPPSYMPCLLGLLRTNYVEDTRIHDVHGRLFVRRDHAGAMR